MHVGSWNASAATASGNKFFTLHDFVLEEILKHNLITLKTQKRFIRNLIESNRMCSSLPAIFKPNLQQGVWFFFRCFLKFIRFQHEYPHSATLRLVAAKKKTMSGEITTLKIYFEIYDRICRNVDCNQGVLCGNVIHIKSVDSNLFAKHSGNRLVR
jgi:hypothetical protein